MKHTSLLTALIALGAATVCFGQVPGAPPAVADTPAPDDVPKPASRARRTTPPAVGAPSETQLAVGAIFSSKTSRGDSIPPVVIRFSESDPKANSELEQDLFVMARVLSRMLERADKAQIEYKMNVPIVLTGAGKSVRPMYIEGVGPLFMIKVNFPVMPAPKVIATKGQPKAADSEWHEAERDLFGSNVEFLVDEATNDGVYNEEKVTVLKREIITALKNATNIRGLKPEEFVNVAVFGQTVSLRKVMESENGRGELMARRVPSSEPGGATKGTVLTLRVRKSDIDAFAANTVNLDAFKAKVSTATYLGSGTGMTSINSWLLDGLKNWNVR
jgi:hypothetical protein